MSTAILEPEVASREATALAEGQPATQAEHRPPMSPPVQRSELDEEEMLYEIEYGQRMEVPSMGILAVRLASEIGALLRWYGEVNGLGWHAVEGMFILDPDRDLRRRPDVAFVSAQRWPLDKPLPAEGDAPVVPDLVVEVISPNDPMGRVMRKVDEYFRYGVRLVWLVLPMLKQVYVYTSPTQVRILSEQDELDGGEVLPGFRVKLAELFAAVPMEKSMGG